MLRRIPIEWLVLAVFCGAAARVEADTVHLKSGGKLVGEIVAENDASIEVRTKFGVQRISRADVARVERGDTPGEELKKKLSELSPSDANGVYELALYAREHRLTKEFQALLEKTVEIDPMHAGANELLGRIKYKGKYVTPEERDRLEAEARREQMLAQGLVEHEGRFVTPEEKEKLEQGLVLRDNEWISADDAKVRDGFVKVADQWIRGEDHWVNETRREVSTAVERPLRVEVSDHVAVYSDIEGDFTTKLIALLEKGYQNFAREFGAGNELAWLGGKRVDIFAFKTRFQYEKFVTWAGSFRGLGADWGERAKRVVSVYGFAQWSMGATYMANRGGSLTAAQCANMLGHILINRYRFEGKALPPFFDESFAAMFEFDLLKKNAVFTLGSGRYERSLQKDELKFFEDGQWIEALRESMRTLADTPLEQAVRRDFSDLIQMDVAKGMCLFTRWRSMGDDTLKRFFDALRDRWPEGNPPPGHANVLQAIIHGFQTIEQKDIPVVDKELRAFAMKKMK